MIAATPQVRERADRARYQREMLAHAPERPGVEWVCPTCGAERPPVAYYCDHGAAK